MLVLVLGLLVFLGVHLVPTAPGVRNGLADRLGANGYRLAFSLASALGLVLIVWGYGEARGLVRANPQVWTLPAFGRHITHLLMLFAFVFLAAAYVPSRIRDRLRHPMLAAIKTWALAHLLVRGDLASLLLFGSFLAYGVYDRISVKRRGALGPLGARTGGARGDVVVVIVGVVAYLAFVFVLHQWLIGVPVVQVRFAP